VITELRRYRLKPDMVASWLSFFRDSLAPSDRHGIRVEYAGLEAGTNTFVWLRSFADEADRERRKTAFYGDAWWTEREAFAMSHVLEYDVTFLDAAIIRDGGALVSQPYPAPGEPAGSRPADGPPDGWAPSPNRTFRPGVAPGR
jgi:NIPSNAP protein